MTRAVPRLLGVSVLIVSGGCTVKPIDLDDGGGFDDGGPSMNVSSGVGNYTPPPWVPAYTSGSRLRARVYDAGGQARSFAGWFDSALAIDCVSTPVSGGPNRCLPPRVDAIVYLDDGCSEAAMMLPAAPASGEAAPLFVVDEHPGEQLCGSFRGWSVGAAQTVTAAYERGPGGGCNPVVTDATVRPLTPVPLETFAALEVTKEEVSGSLWRQVERGTDGSFRAVSGLDGPNGAPCEVVAPPLSAARWCLPSARVRRENVYADGGCGERVVPLDTCALNSLAPIVDLLEDRCIDQTPYVYAAGEIVDALFEEEGACGVGVPGKGRKLGAKQPVNHAPAADSKAVSGQTLDLVLDVFVEVPIRADGTFLHDGGDYFFLCEASKTRIGTRCLPRLILHAHTYADAACTAKVVPVAPTQCPTAQAIGLRAADDTIEHVHGLGDVATGQVYSDATGKCAPIPAGDATWFRLGDELPLFGFDVLASFVE